MKCLIWGTFSVSRKKLIFYTVNSWIVHHISGNETLILF